MEDWIAKPARKLDGQWCNEIRGLDVTQAPAAVWWRCPGPRGGRANGNAPAAFDNFTRAPPFMHRAQLLNHVSNSSCCDEIVSKAVQKLVADHVRLMFLALVRPFSDNRRCAWKAKDVNIAAISAAGTRLGTFCGAVKSV